MARKLKTYRVEIYFVGEKIVTVKAHNMRQAYSKARTRVSKSKIGFGNIRIDMSDAEEVDELTRSNFY